MYKNWFYGIQNIQGDYVSHFKKTAQNIISNDFRNNEDNPSISLTQAASIFESRGIKIDLNKLKEFVEADGNKQMSVDELGAFLAGLDGRLTSTVQEGKVTFGPSEMFKFDGHIPCEGEVDGDMKQSLLGQGTKEEISDLLRKFGVNKD